MTYLKEQLDWLLLIGANIESVHLEMGNIFFKTLFTLLVQLDQSGLIDKFTQDESSTKCLTNQSQEMNIWNMQSSRVLLPIPCLCNVPELSW